MEQNNLPLDELKKFGIINKETNEFSSKLSKADISAFKNGATIIAEDEKNRLTFALKDNNSRLEVNVYNKDIINHKELSSAELFELASQKPNLYKVMADYGVITNIGKTHFADNPQNELTYFVEIENERGKTVFYGNELEEKLKDFAKGDKIQIENSGISKAVITAETSEGIKDFTKYDNVFEIKQFDDASKKFQSKVFEYDSTTKNVMDIDTTKLEYQTINGIKLSDKQLELLRKGKEVKLDDELTVQISPKADNEAKLRASSRTLLITSFAIDGGLTFLLVKSIQRLHRMVEENRKQKEHSLYKTELEKMKSFLQSKAEQYPDNKKIISDLNVVSKELSNVKSTTSAGKQQEKADDSVRLKVNDYDTYEDANRKKEEEKREFEEQREESKSRGRGR